MCADTTIHLSAAAERRHEHTRARAIAAMHELDQAGTALTFEFVARHAGVSGSWIYSQPDLKDEIRRLRAQQQRLSSAPIPSVQRAGDPSLLERLEITTHNRELSGENQRLRRQLAHALGQLREAGQPSAGSHHS
jgi:hypothetical protein